MRMYNRIFGSILDSSVWSLSDRARLVWVTLIAMADSKGFVFASIDGIARRAVVPVEDAEQAMAVFQMPDPRSGDRRRAPENEGRRVEEVDGGWRLLNFDYYRDLGYAADRREQARRGMQELRRRNREGKVGSKPLSSVSKREPSEADPDPEAEATADPPKPPEGVAAVGSETPREQDYQSAYERGISRGKGGAYAMPGQQRGELHQAILAHGRYSKTGEPIRGATLLEWIGDFAEDFARFVSHHKDGRAVGWYSAYGPKGFLKWLNEQASRTAAREVG